MNPIISVVVVSWNAREHLRRCLASIRATAGEALHEIIVVDNASADGSAEMVEREFPGATLIRSRENLGFARAVNLALRRARGPMLAMINSDVVVAPGCLQRLVRQFETHPRTGLAGPRIVGPDGAVHQSCRRLPTVWTSLCRMLAIDRVLARLPLFSGHEMRHFRHDHEARVDVLSGCFWMSTRQAVDDVGLLDERFFFYMEDVDWCRRFAARGWQLHFQPEATAMHVGGGSTANAPLRYSIQYLRANLAYWRKYHGLPGQALFFSIALLHHGLRLLARALLDRRKIAEDAVCVRWLLTGRGVR